MARDKRRTRALTVREIADLSGINARTVKRLSNKTTWDGVRVEVAFAFAKACGVDLMNPSSRISVRKMTWTKRLLAPAVQAWLSIRGANESRSSTHL